MSPVPTKSSRAGSPLARALFWSFSLPSLIALAGLGALAYRLQPALFPTFFAVLGGAAVVVLAANAWLAQRMLRPVKSLIDTMNLFIEGNWEQRAHVTREDEIGQITHIFNQMADEMREVYNLLSIRDAEDQSNGKRQPFLTLMQIISAAPNITELERGALELLLKHYACSFAVLYMIERSTPVGTQFAVLAQSAGSTEGLPATIRARFNEERVNLDTLPTVDWMIGRAIASHRPQVGPVEEQAGLFEAVIPVLFPLPGGEQRMLAIIDLYTLSRVKDSRLGPFSVRAVNELLNLAALLGLALRNQAASFQEAPTTPLKSSQDMASPTLTALTSSNLEPFFIASRSIAHAEEASQIIEATCQALMASPYVSAILLRPFGEQRARLEMVVGRSENDLNEEDFPAFSASALEMYFQVRPNEMVLVDDIQRRLKENPLSAESIYTGVEPPSGWAPLELLQAANMIGAESAAFLPTYRGDDLAGVLVVGRPVRPALRGMQSPPLNPGLLEPYANLLNLATAALSRVQSQSSAQRRLAELETLWQVSQTIAAETQLQAFYPALHQQVESVLGRLSSFAILLFDRNANQVQVPYMVEENKALQIPPFTPANSLSSHVISTSQPLLLRTRQEVVEMSLTVGSRQIGQAALSWLGVPMLFGGEVLGLIVVQDVRQENRFSEADQRLLSTLATQAAVVVRNARLLQNTSQRVQQEQLINEITARIRRSVDVQSILKTTAEELGRALGARRAHIEIAGEETAPPAPPSAPVEAEA